MRGQNKMLKIKSPFYLKAKELRGAMGLADNGHEKRQWHYGAYDWYQRVKAEGITNFSPDLALQLYKEDEGENNG